MKRVPTTSFLRWAREHGIADYRGRHLNFEANSDIARFWSVPTAARKQARFVKHVVAGFDKWSTCYLWPAGGTWESAPPLPASAGLRVRAGSGGAIAFTADERQLLTDTLAGQAADAWNISDDVYVVPDSFGQIAFWSHHDLLHVDFPDADRAAVYEVHMFAGGYEKEPDDYFTGGKRRAAEGA